MLRESPYITVRLVRCTWEPNWDSKPAAQPSWSGVVKGRNLGAGMTTGEAEEEDLLVQQCCTLGGHWREHVLGEGSISLSQFKSSYVLKTEASIPLSIEETHVVHIPEADLSKGRYDVLTEPEDGLVWARESRSSGVIRALATVGLHRTVENIDVTTMRSQLSQVHGVFVPSINTEEGRVLAGAPLPTEWLQALTPGPSPVELQGILEKQVVTPQPPPSVAATPSRPASASSSIGRPRQPRWPEQMASGVSSMSASMAIAEDEGSSDTSDSDTSSASTTASSHDQASASDSEESYSSFEEAPRSGRRDSQKRVVTTATGRKLSAHLLPSHAVSAMLAADEAAKKQQSSRSRRSSTGNASDTASAPVSPRARDEWPESLWEIRVQFQAVHNFATPSNIGSPLTVSFRALGIDYNDT
ncbi:unnamed protein product, partial [Symbiodinium sp. KB8]